MIFRGTIKTLSLTGRGASAVPFLTLARPAFIILAIS